MWCKWFDNVLSIYQLKYLFFFLHQQKLETDCIQDLMNHAVHAQKSLAPALRQVGTSKGTRVLHLTVAFYWVLTFYSIVFLEKFVTDSST